MTRSVFGFIGLVALVALASAPGRAAAGVKELSVGSGSDKTYLVVQFRDGAAYQFDVALTSAIHTGADLINAVDTAFNPGNTVDFSLVAPVDPTYGLDVRRITIVDNGITHTDGVDNSSGGWDGANYWSYWTHESASTAWSSSFVGASARAISTGSWDGWVYADGSVPPPAAAPEPASLALLSLGGLALRRRKR